MRWLNVLLVCFFSAQITRAASIQPLGDFFASGVSADGNAVVGTASTPHGDRPALWRNGSLRILPGMDGQEHVFAQNVSPDGRTVVGEDYNIIGYRWTEATGYQSLPPLGIVWAASADGNGLVGQSMNGAFRWTKNSGPQYITTISAPKASRRTPASGPIFRRDGRYLQAAAPRRPADG